MALVFRLENSDASTTYDFLSASKLQVEIRSWRSQTAGDKVIETFTVAMRDAKADIRTEINSLIALLEQAVEWHNDTTKDDSVWFRFATDGETAKRALVYQYALEPEDGEGFNQAIENEAAAWNLAITRGAAWEAATASSSSGNAANCLGGTIDLTGTISGGTLNGRISGISIVTSAIPLERIWFGVRPLNAGVATFDPVWECEDAGTLSADSDIFADAGNASNDDVVRTRFSDGGGSNAMGNRFSCVLEDRSATIPPRDVMDMVGTYTVLLRYQITVAATEIGVSLSAGLSPAVPSVRNEIQYLEYTGGAYRLAPIGEITIGNRATTNVGGSLMPEYTTLFLGAERINGTGFLYSDCFVLIPSPAFAYLDGTANGSGIAQSRVFTIPDNQQTAFTFSSLGVVLAQPGLSTNSFEYPRDGGIVVLAAERSASQVLADSTSNLSISVYKRWKSYHG